MNYYVEFDEDLKKFKVESCFMMVAGPKTFDTPEKAIDYYKTVLLDQLEKKEKEFKLLKNYIEEFEKWKKERHEKGN